MDPEDLDIFSTCSPLYPDQEWNQLHNAVQASDLHLDHEGETPSTDGVGSSSLDLPEENVVLLKVQNPGEMDSLGREEGVEFPQGPEHKPSVSHSSETSSIVVKASELHQDHEGETPSTDGVGSSNLDPPGEIVVLQVQNLGDLDSLGREEGVEFPKGPENAPSVSLTPEANVDREGETPSTDGVGSSQFDPPGENIVLPQVSTNLSLESVGNDEGEEFPQSPENAPSVSLTRETNSILGKRPRRLPKHHEVETEAREGGLEACQLDPPIPESSSLNQAPAPAVPVSPRRDRGRPCNHAGADLQNPPRQQATQHSRHPNETRGLPRGWITEVKVRKEGRSAGHKDKTYIEVSTNKRCRSLPDVYRYLNHRGNSSEE